MKFNIKVILSIAIFMVGFSATTVERNDLVTLIQDAMKFEETPENIVRTDYKESFLMALNHPAMFDATYDEPEGFEKWNDFLRNPDKKAESERIIAADKASDFYSLNLSPEEIEIFNKYLTDNPEASDLDEFLGNDKTTNVEFKSKLKEQFIIKMKYFARILSNLQIINDFFTLSKKYHDFDDFIPDYFLALMEDAMAIDQNDFRFSNLQKVIETIKIFVEDPLKAKLFGDTVIEALRDEGKYDIVKLENYSGKIKIMRESKKEENNEKIAEEKVAEDKAKLKRERQINIFAFALEAAAEKSTTVDVNAVDGSAVNSFSNPTTSVNENAVDGSAVNSTSNPTTSVNETAFNSTSNPTTSVNGTAVNCTSNPTTSVNGTAVNCRSNPTTSVNGNAVNGSAVNSTSAKSFGFGYILLAIVAAVLLLAAAFYIFKAITDKSENEL